MQWLSTTFLNYLDEWEKEAKSMPGMTTDHKNRLLLSRETHQGLKITGELFQLRCHVMMLCYFYCSNSEVIL